MEKTEFIPDSVLEYGFDFDWDERDVWKLEFYNGYYRGIKESRVVII